MRLRAVLRCAQQIRRALLSRVHPLHHLRSRSGVPVPLGGLAWSHRPLRLLVDDGVPRGADGGFHLRMEERSARMGVSTSPDRLGAPLPPGASQDALLRRVRHEFQEKGFIVARLDKLVNLARTGSMWAVTFCLPLRAIEVMDSCSSA